MSLVLAGAFGTFVIYLALGLGALVVTAGLDRSVGKEKALLGYSLALLLLTIFGIAPGIAGAGRARPSEEKTLPREELQIQGDPFAHANLEHGTERNVFEPYSDTRPLPPPRLAAPPWLPLEFPLPVPVPGPGPAYRHVLRGSLPALTANDGSSIPEIPDATFAEYVRKPEDVYDWVVQAGKRQYMAILAIETNGAWVRETDRNFVVVLDHFLFQQPGWEDMRVRFALVGPEDLAATKLSETDQVEVRRRNIAERRAADGGIERVFIHRSVDVMVRETLRRNNVPFDLTQAQDIEALERAAAELAELGRSGKQNREGWRRAAQLLELALQLSREKAGPSKRAEILIKLRVAYRALNDEKNELRALAEYAQTSPGSHDVYVWLGDMHRQDMHLPDLARGYYQVTLDRNPGHADAWLGMGDAYSFEDQPGRALEAYGKAGPHPDAGLRKATAQLRMGRAKEAMAGAEAVLARDGGNAQAALVRGSALYTLGRYADARSAFLGVSMNPDANDLRAQACYNLALACLMLGQNDAALQALAACEKALTRGSSPGPIPDEAVSPSLGRGLLAFARQDEAGPGAYLEPAGLEAPLSSYRCMAIGAIASLLGIDSTALRYFEAAKQRAPNYSELDGWFAKTYLRQATGAAVTGADPEETARDLSRAVAYSARAADDDARRDKGAYRMRLRETLVRLGAQHLPRRQRYEAARAAVQMVLANPALQEEPIARALAAYADYQLEEYDACIRGFQAVLDTVPDTAQGEAAEWRSYSQQRLEEVKRWRDLEELVVRLEGVNLDPRQWQVSESTGVRLRVEDGAVFFQGTSTKDGRIDDATVYAQTEELFEKETFEEVRLRLRIPREDRQGATNKIVFGVQVLQSRGRSASSAKTAGLGIFFDRTKVTGRVGGGQDATYKDGEVRRLPGDELWPVTADETVEVRIVREDAEDGTLVAYVNGKELLRDKVGGWKRSRGKTLLWIGGYANTAERFDVSLMDIRIIRRKGK